MSKYGSIDDVFRAMHALIDAHQPVHVHFSAHGGDLTEDQDMDFLPVDVSTDGYMGAICLEDKTNDMPPGQLFYIDFEDFQYMTFEPYTPDNDDWMQYL